jgi:uncharacterized protein YxjI
MFKFENNYQVYDGLGDPIGAVKQKLNAGEKILQLLINKNMMPFMLEIRNTDDEVEATISRGWTFWMSKILIKDSSGNTLGSIKQKFQLLKPTFKIFDASEMQIAEITGDWKAWNFKINDTSSKEIGTISKKWAGAAKEFFTTADKYNVNISQDLTNKDHKIAILACAITIDMVTKEV